MCGSGGKREREREHLHIETRGQPEVSFFRYLLSCLPETRFLTGLDLAKLARLPSQ